MTAQTVLTPNYHKVRKEGPSAEYLPLSVRKARALIFLLATSIKVPHVACGGWVVTSASVIKEHSTLLLVFNLRLVKRDVKRGGLLFHRKYMSALPVKSFYTHKS